jgi:CelD/BcsL family acetyltransferase involved in cellulose biosynthesis
MYTKEQNYSITWIDDPQVLIQIEKEWQELANRTDADVYLRPTWFKVWWRHFGGNLKLACLIIRENGKLEGVLPFIVDHIWIGPICFKIAKLAGTDPNSIILKIPVSKRYISVSLDESIKYLLKTGRCLAVSLTPVSELADHLPELRRSVAQNSDVLSVISEQGIHVAFELDSDFEAWLGKLSKKRRSQFRRDRRELTEKHGMQEENTVPNAGALDLFSTFHDLQWQSIGRGGHFTDWPGSRDFYCDLATEATGDPPMRLYSLKGTDGILAEQLALVGGTAAHWRLPARSIDPRFERLGIGRMGLLLMVESLIKEGISRIEAGRGRYEYKTIFGGKEIPVYRFIIRSANMYSGQKLRMFLVFSDFLNIIYYRFWFLKVTPYIWRVFGIRRRPLSSAWIRTRL